MLLQNYKKLVSNKFILVLIVIHILSNSFVECGPISPSQVSLYNESDHVTILNNENFYNHLLGKQHAWLVQFYSSYCGHCISFAPEFKKFVKNIADWGHIIKPAVLNCAMDENTGLCRQYEVFGYPTLTLFPANVSKNQLGKQMDVPRTISALRQGIITYLVEQQVAGNGSASWINLQPFNGSLEEMFDDAPRGVSEGVVFIDDKDGAKAKEAVMDIGYFKEAVATRWMVSSTGFLKTLPVPTSLPALMLLERGATQPKLVHDSILHTAQELVATAVNMLTLEPDVLPSYRLMQEENFATAEEGQGAGDGDDDSSSAAPDSEQLQEQLPIDKLTYDDNLPDAYYAPDAEGSSFQVYLVDIEKTVSHALKHEVSLHKVLSGQRLRALQQFVSVLVRYLPARPKVHAFLSDLSRSLSRANGHMTHAEYRVALDRAAQHGLLPHHQHWLGCRGSEPHLRGFPCGLWTTFHLLTVNAATIGDGTPEADPLETLRAVHGFVKYFFSCKHCSKHFQEMYAIDAETYVTSHDLSILWLWKSHNKVNTRLAGDPTEDPHHPKVQYPPRALCSKCWRQNNASGSYFKEQEVLEYLKKNYAKDAISLRDIVRSDKFSLHRAGRAFNIDERNSARRHSNMLDNSYGDDSSLRPSMFQSLAEISTCVMLYSATTLVIAAVYFGLLLRKKIRRKKFIAMYKNPSRDGDEGKVTTLLA